jgi:hypothetical protein
MIFLIGPPVIRIHSKPFRIIDNLNPNRHKNTTPQISFQTAYEKWNSLGVTSHRSRITASVLKSPTRGGEDGEETSKAGKEGEEAWAKAAGGGEEPGGAARSFTGSDPLPQLSGTAG